jgi:hypothetical protein
MQLHTVPVVWWHLPLARVVPTWIIGVLGLCLVLMLMCLLLPQNQTAFNGVDVVFNQSSVNLSQAAPVGIHVFVG